MALDLLAEQTAVWGFPLSSAQLEQFGGYLALLQEWNERLNLTAVREPAQIALRHFLDSLSCALVTGDLNGRWLIDVGTGAGFPGLPLKILYPELRLTLVESVAKKTTFLQAVVGELGLSQVTILAERAEVLGQSVAHRERYDWAVARGVAELRVLLEYLLPFCRVGGSALAQKGERGLTELAAAETAVALLGGGPAHWRTVQLPGRDTPHHLIVVEKDSPTPEQYPRRAGVAGKRPL
jgi:16S rRNA (guanine527-N7)-methyltransferase